MESHSPAATPGTAAIVSSPATRYHAGSPHSTPSGHHVQSPLYHTTVTCPGASDSFAQCDTAFTGDTTELPFDDCCMTDDNITLLSSDGEVQHACLPSFTSCTSSRAPRGPTGECWSTKICVWVTMSLKVNGNW